jgi:hypothetical protein
MRFISPHDDGFVYVGWDDWRYQLHSQPGIASEIAVSQRPFPQKTARTSVQEGTVSILVYMYARGMVDNIEEPLSHEQILKRFTKIFRREMTAVECRAQVISNEATRKANATQPQVPKS